MRLFVNAVCAGTPIAECDSFAIVPVSIDPPAQPEEYTRFVGLVFEHVVKTGHDVFLTRARPS